ncbi:uroporphyrinogen-III C-methyltransferase [Ferrimonas gelatinilytica]|uniref:uroporphyrinogen-III C-methyltransferase n=1 Tax=Ferrimonas gelatinilytica TaxID=1255257 RepID=A0ABP9S7Z4_9GAMM
MSKLSLSDVVNLPTTAAEPVVLVGAGPGDPGLLTLHAYSALQQADVVLHDALVSEAILALLPERVERIPVGKRCGTHSMDQREIERVMVAKAVSGRRVVRLKGGDAMMFARVGEEMMALKRAGVPYRVVPGVTAASACSAYGAMPLTHRAHSQGVTLITGRGKGGAEIEDWRPYVACGHTLVIYMGQKRAASIRDGLLQAGMSPDYPVAIVGQASQPGQQRLIGTLSNLAELAASETLPSPAAIVVGEVVGLAPELDWFEPGDPDCLDEIRRAVV